MTASPGGTITVAFASSGVSSGNRKTFPRRASVGKKIERLVAAEGGCFTLIAELRDLFPLPIRAEQVKGEIAAVTIRHGRDNVFSVTRSFEHDLGDARSISVQKD